MTAKSRALLLTNLATAISDGQNKQNSSGYVRGIIGDAVDSAFLVEDILRAVEWLDTSGTVTLGGTAQTALSANPSTVRLKIIVPLTAADSIYIGLGVVAVVGVGDPIGPGQSYDSGWPVSAADKLAVSVISATTGVAYTIRRKVLA